MEEASPYRILIVEDNPDIVIGLQDLLQHDGYHVTVATCCATAFAQIREQRFNAILLDLALPDGHGADVLKEMQRLDASVPVIILTAHIAQNIAQERTVGSQIEGAFAYITKPYNREELRQTLRRAIGTKELVVKMRRVEHLLNESEDRFRSLVESASDAIVLADGRGTIVSWNRAASVLFGYSQEEAVGRPLTILMPARYRQAHERGLARMEATGQSRVIGSIIELHGLRNDGTEFPIELSLATWQTESGNYYSGIIRDISGRKRTEQTLDQLRRRQSLILTQAGEGIYGLDLDGRATFVNPSAAAILGYDVEELIGQHMHHILHHTKPDGTPYPIDQCPVHAAMKDGFSRRVVDEMFWRKDGTALAVEYVSTPIKEGNEVVGSVIVFQDVTERIAAQRALRASEERLELVIRGSSDGFWDAQPVPGQHWTSPQTHVWYSARFKEMLGYTDQEFPDFLDSWATKLHPEDRDRVFAALTAHIEQRAPYDIEYRLLTKQHGYHWFRVRAQALWDESGTVVRMAGSLQSIMDRRRTEETIRRKEQLLRSVADNTTAVIYVKDSDGRYLLTNRRFEQLFNLTSDRIIGHTDHEFFPVEFADKFRANDLDVLTRNMLVEYEETAPHPDGPRTYISIKLPLQDEHGRPYAMCGISTDITERKRMEETLKAQDALLRLALQAIDIGVWNWDLATGRICWSPQVNRFFSGVAEARMLTMLDWLALVFPEDRELLSAALSGVKDQPGDDLVLEHRIRKQQGGTQRVVWTGRVIRDREGKPIHVLGTVGGISEAEEQGRGRNPESTAP
jgi:PAS domain S-box-containing protein